MMGKYATYIMIMALIVLLPTAACFAETFRREKELHFAAWQQIAQNAASIPHYKYALYASRSLAVKHPELYLQGDAVFARLLTSLPNMLLHYTTRDKNISKHEELVQSFRTLPNLRANKFSWDNFDLSRHEEIGYQDLYQDAFLFPFLDLRLPPLGVSLLGWDYKATPLALAQMLYFQLNAQKDVGSVYLLVAETGQAYVASFDRRGNASLFDHRGAEREPAENIVLIFNDQRVWYPLMERDDTKRDKNLAHLVTAYEGAHPLPRLTQEEGQLMALLQDVTGMGKTMDKRWMSVAASRLHTRAWGLVRELQKLYPRWSGIHSSHGPDIFTNELAFIHRLGNKLSPAASHLAAYALAVYDNYTAPYYTDRLNHTLNSLSRRYNTYMGVNVVLYPWWYHSEMHFLNIDDSVLSKRANCIMISTNLAGILDVAQIPELTTYQVYIPGHVLLLMTGEKGYYSILDNNRFYLAEQNYVPTAIRALGLADGWLRLQDFSEPYGLKDVYTNLEPESGEQFIRTTLKDLSGLCRHSSLTIAKPMPDRTFETQTYEDFLAKIDRGAIKIRKWQ